MGNDWKMFFSPSFCIIGFSLEILGSSSGKQKKFCTIFRNLICIQNLSGVKKNSHCEIKIQTGEEVKRWKFSNEPGILFVLLYTHVRISLQNNCTTLIEAIELYTFKYTFRKDENESNNCLNDLPLDCLPF